MTSELIGYHPCRQCFEYVPELTWHQLGWLCFECYEASPERDARLLEVAERGRTHTLRIPRPRKKGSRGSKGARTTRQVRKHAERAALIRLKAMFPEAYQLLYTEERIRRGLPVVPAKGAATGRVAAAYHEPLDRGER